MTNLTIFGLFFRNNAPDGFGITFRGKEAQQMLDKFEHYYSVFRRQPKPQRTAYLSTHAYEDLAKAAALYRRVELLGRQMTAEENAGFLTLGPLTVYILVREGRLANDEFNGTMFVKEAQSRR